MTSDQKISLVVVGIVGAIVLFFIFNPFVQVGAGERGVLLNWGAVQDEIKGEGLHFRIPIMQDIKKVDIKTKLYEVEALVYSKDTQTVTARIALNYSVKIDSANKLLQEIGSDYQDKVITPAIQEATKSVIAKYTAQDLLEKRDDAKNQIKTQLFEKLDSRFLNVEAVSIMNFDFSKAYEKAVEAKQVAQQDALTAENKLKQVQFEADQRVAQAKAEATAIKIQAEAITQQGGAEYVRLKAIEKWSGTLPIQMIPNGTLPFIDLSK